VEAASEPGWNAGAGPGGHAAPRAGVGEHGPPRGRVPWVHRAGNGVRAGEPAGAPPRRGAPRPGGGASRAGEAGPRGDGTPDGGKPRRGRGAEWAGEPHRGRAGTPGAGARRAGEATPRAGRDAGRATGGRHGREPRRTGLRCWDERKGEGARSDRTAPRPGNGRKEGLTARGEGGTGSEVGRGWETCVGGGGAEGRERGLGRGWLTGGAHQGGGGDGSNRPRARHGVCGGPAGPRGLLGRGGGRWGRPHHRAGSRRLDRAPGKGEDGGRGKGFFLFFLIYFLNA
jgi:hypothetical protein